jgi:hypothetical protein
MVPAAGPASGPGAFQGPVAWAPPEQRNQPGFNSFSPQPEPTTEPPAPHVRNGRVLAAVLAAAVLLLVVPLGIVWLLTGGEDSTFDPAVGACVKQEGSSGAVTAKCGDQGAFKVVSKVDSPTKCADQTQPYIDVKASGGDKRVLCLGPASSAATPGPATTSGG